MTYINGWKNLFKLILELKFKHWKRQIVEKFEALGTRGGVSGSRPRDWRVAQTGSRGRRSPAGVAESETPGSSAALAWCPARTGGWAEGGPRAPTRGSSAWRRRRTGTAPCAPARPRDTCVDLMDKRAGWDFAESGITATIIQLLYWSG